MTAGIVRRLSVRKVEKTLAGARGCRGGVVQVDGSDASARRSRRNYAPIYPAPGRANTSATGRAGAGDANAKADKATTADEATDLEQRLDILLNI